VLPQDNIAPEVMEAVKPYLAKADFQPAKMKQVSQAASGLCAWVRAMETYDRVAKVVRPKKAALKEAEGQLAVVMQVRPWVLTASLK
jgi:dynein heavy chain, axonemal